MWPSTERANEQLDSRQQLANTLPPQSTTLGLHPISVHQMAPPKRTSNCSLLLIYRPRKDERLSWPSWLTYSVSQKKVAPLKLFAIFSLRLSIFPRNFANLLPAYIHTCLPILVDLSYYITKWRFLGVLIVFTVSSFEFQQVRLP